MVRARQLDGRAVVDIDAAEKLGKIDEIILDPDAARVAAFTVTRTESLLNGKHHITVPASAVHALGPDALTVRHRAAVEPLDDRAYQSLPRVSDVVGRRVVSESGRLLGKIDDVLIDGENGTIVGYTLAEHGAMGKLEGMFGIDAKREHAHYLRADASLRAGDDLIVAPDNAVHPLPDRDTPADDATRPRPAGFNAPTTRWLDPVAAGNSARTWSRRGSGENATASSTRNIDQSR
jgi:sporulation protein YlmC with PRC-barrel domain